MASISWPYNYEKIWQADAINWDQKRALKNFYHGMNMDQLTGNSVQMFMPFTKYGSEGALAVPEIDSFATAVNAPTYNVNEGSYSFNGSTNYIDTNFEDSAENLDAPSAFRYVFYFVFTLDEENTVTTYPMGAVNLEQISSFCSSNFVFINSSASNNAANLFIRSTGGRANKSLNVEDFLACTYSRSKFIFNREDVTPTLLQGCALGDDAYTGANYYLGAAAFLNAGVTTPSLFSDVTVHAFGILQPSITGNLSLNTFVETVLAPRLEKFVLESGKEGV